MGKVFVPTILIQDGGHEGFAHDDSDDKKALTMKQIQKHNLFKELKQGIQEVKAHQKGKITLRTHEIKKKPRL